MSMVDPSESEPAFQCSLCRDLGSVHPLVDGQPDWGRIIPCRCTAPDFKLKGAANSLIACKLPVGSETYTFTNYVTDMPVLRDAFHAAVDLSEEIGQLRWLTLSGNADMGKTHLAVAICRRWLERGKQARFCVGSLLLKELRDGFEMDEAQSYRRRFDFLCRVPLLVIDDLGMENPTPWAREQMQTLIDFRYFNQLPLVVTTNKDINNLGAIDPERRISSRLQREAFCRVVAMAGVEYRLRRLAGGKVQ